MDMQEEFNTRTKIVKDLCENAKSRNENDQTYSTPAIQLFSDALQVMRDLRQSTAFPYEQKMMRAKQKLKTYKAVHGWWPRSFSAMMRKANCAAHRFRSNWIDSFLTTAFDPLRTYALGLRLRLSSEAACDWGALLLRAHWQGGDGQRARRCHSAALLSANQDNKTLDLSCRTKYRRKPIICVGWAAQYTMGWVCSILHICLFERVY